jgi:hypothetical protein
MKKISILLCALSIFTGACSDYENNLEFRNLSAEEEALEEVFGSHALNSIAENDESAKLLLEFTDQPLSNRSCTEFGEKEKCCTKVTKVVSYCCTNDSANNTYKCGKVYKIPRD